MSSAITYKNSGVWVSNGTRDEILFYLSRRAAKFGKTQAADQLMKYNNHLGAGMGLELDEINVSEKELLNFLEKDQSCISDNLNEEVKNFLADVFKLLRKMISRQDYFIVLSILMIKHTLNTNLSKLDGIKLQNF